MLRLYWLLKGKLNNWLFYRAFKMAPIKRLGAIYVKEVQGNLYAVVLDNARAKCDGWKCSSCGANHRHDHKQCNCYQSV